MTDTTWTPGDPLHTEPPSGSVYLHRALFNFRDDNPGDHCLPCSDAARWPVPRDGNVIHGEDEVEALIRAVRRDRANPTPPTPTSRFRKVVRLR